MGVPRKTMRSQFRAGKVGMNVSSFQWWKVGGEREERDRIIPTSGKNIWVCLGAVTEMGTSEEKQLGGAGGGGGGG